MDDFIFHLLKENAEKLPTWLLVVFIIKRFLFDDAKRFIEKQVTTIVAKYLDKHLDTVTSELKNMSASMKTMNEKIGEMAESLHFLKKDNVNLKERIEVLEEKVSE